MSLQQLGNRDSTYNLRRAATKRVIELCNTQYEEEWLSEIEDLLECEPDQDSMLSLACRLSKRFAMWIIATVVFCCVVATTITTTSVVLNNNINVINENLEKAQKEVENIKNDINIAKTINEIQSKNYDYLLNNTDLNEKAIVEQGHFQPEIQSAYADIKDQIYESKRYLEDLQKSCRRGKVDTWALGQLFKLKNIRELIMDDTYLDKIYQHGNNSIGFKFLARRRNNNIKFGRIRTTKHWANYTTIPTYVTYTGPKYIMINTTNHCVKGIENIDQNNEVFDKCYEYNYKEPEIFKA